MNSLLKRSLSAVGIALCMGVGLLISPWLYVPFALFAMCAMMYEYFNLNVHGKRYRKEKACIYLAALTLFAVAIINVLTDIGFRWVFLAVFPVLLCQMFMLFDCHKDLDLNVHIFFPLIYIALPVFLSIFLVLPGGEFNRWLLISVIMIAWLNDIGAYIFGMSFGQRPNSKKLAPHLSPKKSWIGVVGGTLFSFAAAWLSWKLFGSELFPLLHWMAIALLISIFGVCGDLFESLIKRHSSVKDASNFIPGHGGMLDRFDDILFVIPAVVAYLKLFELI